MVDHETGHRLSCPILASNIVTLYAHVYCSAKMLIDTELVGWCAYLISPWEREY